LFQLLQPIWLFALAGVSIPVIIYLWNPQPGKTLKVGSIALVKESGLLYKKRIKPAGLLLLLLRVLLLACIALALAGPLWRNPANTASKGWVLMARPQLTATYNRFKPMVDSLLQAGLEFHYFEEGFKKDKLSTALQVQADSTGIHQPSYRGTIALLDQQADTRVPLYVFTDNYLRHFGGRRLPVSLNLHWFTYTPDTVATKPVTDTMALRVTIFTRVYANDARCLKAALDAIQQFSKRNIITEVVTAAADIPARQDWLFWLDDALPVNVHNAKNVLSYAKGRLVKRMSCILPAMEQTFAAVSLYQSIIENDAAKQSFSTCWQDGFGHTLLSVQQEHNTAFYWLYTHIDPAWNDLPWSDNFPAILFKLLYTGRVQDVWAGAPDKTIIDSSQSMPILLSSGEAAPKPAIFTETKLAGICWLLAFLLFFAERCLSFYHLKSNANG
jgi:hypothetical protein